MFVTPVGFEVGIRGRPLLALGGHNGSARKWDPHNGDAVGKPLIRQRCERIQARSDAMLTEIIRSRVENFSPMPVGCCPRIVRYGSSAM